MSTQAVLVNGKWRASHAPQGIFRAIDPATGEAIGAMYPISGADDLDAVMTAAVAVADELAGAEPATIAAFLDAYATAIEADAATLVALAHAETALPAETRLAKVELPRTCGQLRQAARAVREYSWTQPIIDRVGGQRSHRAPLQKPVLIFGPNNFPFAFNAVAGSDFASAIAARNPVIVKAHPNHPATSERLAQLAHDALRQAGLPAATVQMLYHFNHALGKRVAGDRRLGAIAFTGSRAGGLALKAAADAAGVLAYVELSSVNPVFVLPGALAERGKALAQEFFASCTMGAGQFCTNPGVLVLPTGAAGDAFAEAATRFFAEAAPGILFAESVQQQLQKSVAALQSSGAQCLAGGQAAGPGFRFQPTLLSVDAATFLSQPDALQSEAFGPVSLLVRAGDTPTMVALARAFEGNLTGTLYSATNGSDEDGFRAIAQALRPRVGRLISNRMPTGVAVSPAMNHGGPYPSTGHPGFTAVGLPAAILRFTALHCYDNVPDAQLPLELRDQNPAGVARQVDGVCRNDSL